MTATLLTAHGIAATHVVADRFSWADTATILAGLGAALIAAIVAVLGYSRQKRAQRRDQRAITYAQALQAVEDYLEGPYRIRRRDGTAQARRQISEDLSGTKSRINFHLAWLSINGSDNVAVAYQAYVSTAQREAGPQMTAAWRSRPTHRDRDVPLGQPISRQSSDAARAAVLQAMKTDLAK